MLKAHPHLPQGESGAGTRWFTLEDVLSLRNHFATEGSSAKEHRPYRPDGENANRRAAGLPEQRFEWDAVRVALTRYDAGQHADLANVVQAYFGDMMAPHRQEFTA